MYGKIHTMEVAMNRKNSEKSILEKCNPKTSNKKCKSMISCKEKHAKVGKPVGFKHTASWVRDASFVSMLNNLLNAVDERKRRQIAGLLSTQIGFGGDTSLSEITGIHVDTIRLGREELNDGLSSCQKDRIRKKGGGAKKVEDKNPEIEKALDEIVENNIAGDPCSSKKWVRLALEEISKRLKKQGFKASSKTISRLLKKRDIHLR